MNQSHLVKCGIKLGGQLRQKVALFGQNSNLHVWHKLNTALSSTNPIPNVKSWLHHAVGTVLFPQRLLQETLLKLKDGWGKIQRDTARLLQSAEKLHFGRNFTIQQDDDLKHKARATRE